MIQQYDLSGITGWYMFNSNVPNDLALSGYTLSIIKAGSDSVSGDNPNIRISGNTAWNGGGAGDNAGTGLTNQVIVGYDNPWNFGEKATFMGWAKATAFPNYMSPFALTRNFSQIWRVYVPSDTLKPTAQRFNTTTSNTVASTTAISANVWYHYAMTFNTVDNKMYFYIDGVSIGNITLSAGNRNDNAGASTYYVNGFNIGFAQKFKELPNPTLTGTVHDRWKGQVDDVRFYAFRCMTGTEVLAAFNNTKRYYGK